MNTDLRADLAFAASAALTLTLAGTTGAAALRPTPTIAGWPKCVTTTAGAKAHGWPLTRRGEVCAAKMVGTRVTRTQVEYVRTQPRTEGWEFLGLIFDPVSGELVGNLVRRPR